MWDKVEDYLYKWDMGWRVMYCIQLGNGKWYLASGEREHPNEFACVSTSRYGGYDTVEECQDSYEEYDI
jgi:hypothetical protein